MYPMLRDGVTIGTFQYKGSNETHYYIENPEGYCLEIGFDLWLILRDIDGTKPLIISGKNQRVLRILKNHGMISTSRFVKARGIFNRFILFPISKNICKQTKLFKILNYSLLLLSLFSVGICLSMMDIESAQSIQIINLELFFGLCIASFSMHEVGHLVAGIAYGYKLLNIGVLLIWVIPVGAYVAYEDRPNATKIEKIQFALSGIEVNVLVAGICLIVACLDQSLAYTLLSVAKFNCILAGLNLMPASGLDGEAVLSAISGVSSISDVAKKSVFDRKLRKRFLSSGWKGYARLFGLMIILTCKILPWLIVACEEIDMLFRIFC